MAITVDPQRRPFGAVGFDSMSSFPNSRPFTDPWTSTPTSAAGSMSVNSLFALGLDQLAKPPLQRAGAGVSMPYTTVPVSAPSVSTTTMPISYGSSEMLNVPNQHLGGAPRLANEAAYPSDLAYSSAPSPRTQAHVPAPPPPPPPAPSPYDALACTSNRSAYATQAQAAAAVPALSGGGDRRWSQPAMPPPAGGYLAAPMEAPRSRQASLAELGRSLGASAGSRDDYADAIAINGARGMMVLEDDNTTPRNIFDVQSRDAADSYGFPATHSSSSSVSSTSPYPSYYGSMDSSVSGYSSNTESIDSVPSRSLHRPHGSVSSSSSGAVPPAPQSMMGQFNSKVSSSAQKKHRCRICDKRFTRPSSLRTHMYSHTGEKPFCCDVDGCGRHFSVVSNLRRHRKVHRGERDVSSPEEC